MPHVVMPTPLGPLHIDATEAAVVAIKFVASPAARAALAVPPSCAVLDLVVAQLKAYFAGHLRQFDVPLAPPGTDFQQRAWWVLRGIPYGETLSYQAQAQRLGQARAVRAVASANRANPIAIVIPCHRVIGKDGQLRGYAGGLERKRALLELEAQLGLAVS
jgi:methylated-DNA-[protein]-cysteine S-methyltransferase